MAYQDSRFVDQFVSCQTLTCYSKIESVLNKNSFDFVSEKSENQMVREIIPLRKPPKLLISGVEKVGIKELKWIQTSKLQPAKRL
jgi:hypothetical protein